MRSSWCHNLYLYRRAKAYIIGIYQRGIKNLICLRTCQTGFDLFLLMPSILPASRSHRESVLCETPTSSERAVALVASAPVIRDTIRRLNVSGKFKLSLLSRPRGVLLRFPQVTQLLPFGIPSSRGATAPRNAELR